MKSVKQANSVRSNKTGLFGDLIYSDLERLYLPLVVPKHNSRVYYAIVRQKNTTAGNRQCKQQITSQLLSLDPFDFKDRFINTRSDYLLGDSRPTVRRRHKALVVRVVLVVAHELNFIGGLWPSRGLVVAVGVVNDTCRNLDAHLSHCRERWVQSALLKLLG